MKRMSVWKELEEIARSDPSERIRRIAATRHPRRFTDRLHTFSANVEVIQVTKTKRPLFWSTLIDIAHPVRAKSAEVIRQILKRITHFAKR
jgi:hypothetical protein